MKRWRAMMRKVAVTVALFVTTGLFAILVAGGQQPSTPQQAQQPGKAKVAELLASAEGGDAKAQFALAKMYGEGQGVPTDDSEAVKWVRKASEQGHAKAHFRLGLRYHDGQGVPQDYAQAVAWFHRAAEQAHAKGCSPGSKRVTLSV